MPGQEVLAQRSHRVGRDLTHRLSPVPREALQEVLDEHRHVFLAFTERRHQQRDDVEPIEQVLSKGALGDQLAQVPVGRANHPHVDGTFGSLRADLLQLSGFEKAEHERLHAQCHFADLVQKHGARIRDFELAGLVAIGARETAFDVPEELRFQERFRQPRAVHHDERPRGSRSLRLNRTGNELLTDAALTCNENLGV